MINEKLRKVIEESLRQSYQSGDDCYEMRRLAQNAAISHGREYGILGSPISDEEIAAVVVAVDLIIKQTPPETMIAVVRLEFIAENYYMYRAYKERGKIANPSTGAERYGEFLGRNKSRPWIARITGYDPTYGLARTFMNGHADYRDANNNGSRGVFLVFHLRSGIYEVNERTSWRNVRRYFIRVEGATIHEIEKKEVEEWISQ